MAKTTAKNSVPRKTKKAADTVAVQHAEMLETEQGLDSLLDALSSGGDLPTDLMATAGEPEILEPSAPEVVLSDEEQAHAIGHVEAVSAALNAALPGAGEVPAVPTGTESDAAPLDPAAAVDAASAPAAKVVTPRKHYTDKVERIKDRLGAAAADFTVLTLADADIDAAELHKVMDNTFDLIRGMNKKEQNRASLLFDFLTGKKAKLNNVLETTLRVLNRDGHVSVGKSGNLLTELIGKPYSIGSARAMSGNTVGMYHDLKLLKADGKGRFVGNPDSLLLVAANAKLGLNTAAAST